MARIGPELFSFLEDLKRNNRRDWFEENRERYEKDVREPLLAFVRAFEEPLARISPSMTAVAKKSGGSLFRIHRDVRFSKDKSPYKTWAALQFRHERGKDVHAPGYYLHLEPDEVFVGAGMWRPASAPLAAVRERIDERPDEWTAARDEVVAAGWELGGDSLKTAPRGYSVDHPMIEDIRRKDFIVSRPLRQADVTRADFVKRYAELCAETTPFMRFVADALEVRF